MASFPAEILLRLKAEGIQQQVAKVEGFIQRLDTRAASVAARLEKLRIPDQTFARVAKKSSELNKLIERSNALLARRTARLQQQNTLTNSLVKLERKRRDLVRERLRDEAQLRGETQYSRAIGPNPAAPGTSGQGSSRFAGQGGLTASIGFPLLFGGGAGSIVGGAVGSLLGGFGPSILGSGVGSALDRFIDKITTTNTIKSM